MIISITNSSFFEPFKLFYVTLYDGDFLLLSFHLLETAANAY